MEHLHLQCKGSHTIDQAWAGYQNREISRLYEVSQLLKVQFSTVIYEPMSAESYVGKRKGYCHKKKKKKLQPISSCIQALYKESQTIKTSAVYFLYSQCYFIRDMIAESLTLFLKNHFSWTLLLKHVGGISLVASFPSFLSFTAI